MSASRSIPHDTQFEKIPFRMHPRVFSALGADLVTNDVVAVIELVKNSYDAFSRNVWIRFQRDGENGTYLEIEDDGQGMTRDVIENAWCLVATPFKELNPLATREGKTRRVAGEKGLGRLSVARLGDRLHMLTQAADSPCWEVNVTWSTVSSGDDLATSFAELRPFPGPRPFRESGTILRIYGLRTAWDDNRISDLDDNLSRLLSPFAPAGDFTIFLTRPGQSAGQAVKVESPAFLAKPKYVILGDVDSTGNMKCSYKYTPLRDGDGRSRKLALTWEQVYDSIQDPDRFPFDSKSAHCGPFSFEVRAWDIGSEDAHEIADKFDFPKSQVRKAIRAHKGISIYRDGVLVLPKSEGARDWLGLDLRRISKVGTRLSTSQLVGYVSISAEKNPQIHDTSDRERLVSSLEVAEFEELLKAVVAMLENERDADRITPEREQPMEDLFGSLDAGEMLDEVTALSQEGAEAAEAIPLLRAFSASLDDARSKIQERFVFYSRLATVGTIAQMLVHEIRNRTTAFGSFLEFITARFGPVENFRDKALREEFRSADAAVAALEQLADTFSPLASRAFRRRKRDSMLEERIRECLRLQRGEIGRKGITTRVADTSTPVAVDPGELDAILLNLITNSIYWLGQVPQSGRKIEFRLSPINDGDRVRVWVHDTGPGLHAEDVEKVFLPGVTRKPGGIGMGLTVASELVAQYGGRMAAKHPGTMGGASFVFDLPIKK